MENANVNLERNEKYNKMVKKMNPKSKSVLTIFNAFWIGGLICTFGELLVFAYSSWFPDVKITMIYTYVLITIIFLACFLTGIGVFDKIANIAGAGTILPITGFANSICAPAIEFKREGIIFGLCVKMFTVAGPVIVMGTVGSIIVGLVYIFL